MATMTLNMDDRHMAVLDGLAVAHNMSKTAIMIQALRLYQVVEDRTKDGQQLAFVKDGTVIPVLIPSMLPLSPRNEIPEGTI